MNIIKKEGIRYGIILGLLLALVTIFMFFNLTFFVNFWVGLGIKMSYIVMGIIAIYHVKKKQNGFISFKEAFTVFFIVFLIGIACQCLSNSIIFNGIDPKAKEIVKELFVEYTLTMSQKQGITQEEIAKNIDIIKQSDDFSVPKLMQSALLNILPFSLIGFLMAWIFKNTHKQTIATQNTKENQDV